MTQRTHNRIVRLAVIATLVVPGLALADQVLFDFESGAQGWTAFGPITTDSGLLSSGAVGQGRFHVGDFALAGWGMVDVSPVVDLSAYTGMRVMARLVDVAGQPAFAGTPEMKLMLAIGYAEWSSPVTLASSYQFFSVNFADLVPDGTVATAPITPAQLSDPGLQIKLVMLKGTNTGVGELDYDQVTGIGGGGPTQYLPGEVIYSFDASTNGCYPDQWTFFGISQTDFGFYADAEDGGGAFQAVDWTTCDIYYGPVNGCKWAGSAIGVGVFNHPQCTPGGVSDANLDLSLGTGLSIRLREDISAGGTTGARVQVQLVDADGTTAVSPRTIIAHPAVNRTQPVPEAWTTVNFFFAGLDWANDNDDADAGAVPGLDLSHIKEIKFLWRRYTAAGINVFAFDEITLINAAPVLWADDTSNGTVDVADYAGLQECFGGAPPAVGCELLDADLDGDIDLGDAHVFNTCLQGPDVTSDFFSWCY